MSARIEVALYSALLDRTLLLRRVGQRLHIYLYAGHCELQKSQLAAWAGPQNEVVVISVDLCGDGQWLGAGYASFALHDHAEAEAVQSWLAITAPVAEVAA